MKKLYNSQTDRMTAKWPHRIRLLLFLILVSQVSLAQTISFNEITDAHDTNLGTVYTSGNFRFTMTDGSFFVSDQGNGATKGLRPVTSGAGAGAGTSLTIETIDGSEVQFESFYVNPSIIGYVDLTSIEGFKNGLSTGSNTSKITNPGKADMATFLADVDKIILKSNMFLVAIFDDFVFSAASETANVAPLVTAPTAPTVTEDATDVAIADDIQLAEADLEDSHILTFTIMGGTLSLGESGITFGGNGNKSASFTAQGSVADLNTAMDAATFTPTPNLSGRGVASISFVANDGKEDSNTASVAFNINNVKDDPTFSSSAVTDLKGDKTYEYEIAITDPDNDDLTVVATTKPDWLTLSGIAAGTATTLAGSGSRAVVNGQGTSASFDRVQVLDVSKSGVVYVIEGFTIRKIEPDGQVTTFAGTGISGSQDGTGTMASFDFPSDLAVDTNGNIYLADLEDNSVRKITPDGVVTTLADGFLSRYLSVDGSGNVYVLDVSRNIWKVTASGVVSAVSNPKTYGSPTDLAADIEGNLYLTVNGTYVIKLTKSGSEVILAGSADAGNQNGIATDARFTGLFAIDVDETGMVYVTEKSVNHYQIRKITPQGVVTTVAGKAAIGVENGTVAAAGFNYPWGIGVDAQGNVYVPDENNNLIRKIAAATHTLTGNAAAEVGTHDVVLTVSDGNGGSVTQSFGIFVSDVVEFDATTSGGNESVSAADIPVSLSKSLITEASVDYAISGTAQNGSDYTLAAGTLLFAAGDLTKNITIGSIVDDTESETNETIILTLSNAVGIDLGNQKVHTYTINDNDPSTANAGADQNVCGSGAFLGGVPPNGNETSQWSIISGTGGSLRDANNPNTEFTGNHGTTYTLRWTITKGSGTSTDDVQITFLDNPTAAAAGVDQITRNSSVTLAANAASGFQETGTWSIVSGAGGSFNDANSPTATFQGVHGVTYTLRWTVSNGECPGSSDDVLITILENNTPVFTSTPATSVNDNSSYRYYIHASDDDEDDLTITATTKPDWLTLSSLPAGALHTFAGASASGNKNGFATDARFNLPIDVALDADGNVFVVEENNNQIRKISTDGQVSTFATGLNYPAGIAIDASGNIYVADTQNHLIKKITKEGVVTTQASGISQPYGIAVDAQGVVYVTSILGNTIHKVSTSGQVTTLAGTGNFGSKNGTGTEAGFSYPAGLALDATGNIYVADWGNNLVRQITPAGVVTTLAGSGAQASTDGSGTAASFDGPRGITVGADGIIYVTENNSSSGRIRKIQGGNVTTLASTLPSATNRLASPEGLTVDKLGNIYVADVRNHSIKILPAQAQPVLSGSAVGQKGKHDVTLKADDGFGGGVEQSFTVTLNDITDPVFTSATAIDFAENGTGTAYTVVATDVNTLIYSLGTGNDEALFDIAAGVVTFKSSPDFESPADGDANNTYVINVIASDGINSVNQDVTITVTNIDDTDPVFTSATAVDFTENGTGTVYTVAATDANSLTYSLGTGNDEALFDIATGVVTFKTSPDFENPTDGDANNTYLINVIASDGINSVNQDVTITVTNVDDTDPVFTSATAVDFAENGTGTAYAATATDANALTYSLGSGNDEALFDIAGGVVTFKTSPDFESPGDANKDNAYVINVTVGDGVNSVGQLVTITVTNVNEAPSFISSAVTSVDDNATYNYAIAADDRDGDNLTITAVTKPDWLTLTSTSGNEVTTLAGSGSASSTNGTGTQASFNEPGGIAVDAAGNVYVAELLGHVIRKITPNGEVTTLAGSGSAGSANGTGTEASFNRPQGVAVDASGNVYVADFSNNLIRKITSEGVVTTFAGSGTAGSDNGPGTFASFNAPIGVAVDVANNVYVATFSGNLIRKISPAGVVSTLAGSGEYGNSNGNGTDASFFLPQNLAVDISGNVYVVGTQLVRKITPNGDVTTLAGSGATGKVDANGTNASFTTPSGVSVDAFGNVFIADSGNNLIRKITPNGDVTTLAGSGSKGSSNADGLAASFDFPNAIAVDASGNVYVSDVYNHLIRKISTTSHLLTGDAAGQSGAHNVTLTASDGNGGTAEQSFTITINDVTNPVFSSATAVDFAENGTGVAYAVSAADTNPVTYSLGSDNDEALFDIAAGVVTFKSSPDFENPVDGDANNTYVINVIASDGINPVNQDVTITVTNVDDTDPIFTSAKAVDFTENSAGTAYTITATDANTLTYSLGSGNDEALFDISAGIVTFKTSPDFECPADANTDNAYVINVIASDGSNAVNQDVTITVTNVDEAPEFLSDAVTSVDDNKDYSYNIRVSDQEGDNLTVTVTTKPDWLNLTLDEPLSVSTIAGSGETDGKGTGVSKDGTGSDAAFGFPRSIVTDASGNIYMADLVAGAIRKIDQNAVVTTVAGNTTYEHKDGSGTNASFNGLNGIALGPQGNLYITSQSSIRKMTPEGVVSTLAGTSDGSTGYMDGTGSEALFSALSGITYDAVTNALYVTDIRNARIRKVTLDGVVTTFAGNGTVGNDNGTASAASFNSPHDIVVDSKGNFYVADTQSRRIRKITASGMVSTFAGSSSGFKDGKGTAAQFDYFTSITIDNEDILYVADAENNRIRRISPEGVVSTLVGGEQGYIDGDINVARLTRPRYLTVDADQNLILFGGTLRLRRVNIDRGNQLKGSPVGQKGTFNVTLSLTDGTNDPVTQSFTVTVNDATKPAFTSTETVAFAENGTGTVYTALATDTNPVTYSLGTDNDESLFNIDGTSGAVTFKTSPDFENPADSDADNAYVINVIASDGINSVNQDVTITVTNVDDTDPVFTSTTATDFAENGTGTVYTVAATDANSLTYSLGTGNDEALFDITAGVVTFKSSPDFENPADGDANNAYVINVIASDGINSVNQDVTITVTNVDDTDPVFTSGTAVDFAENGTGTAYTVVATDANALTYSLGTGNDEALFDIAAGVVTFKTSPDFENPADGNTDNAYVINVIASDGINSVNQDVTITVTNVDDTDPVFTSGTAVDFTENGTGTVYTVAATDANSLTYSLGTGNDEALFDIAAGVVTFKTSPDFENPADGNTDNAYVINVIASDGINSVNQDVTITVTNVDDTDPVFTSATAVDFAENSTGTTYTIAATDANALTYSLGTEKDETLFNLDQNSGVVTFKATPDFENPVDSDANNTYVINVIASDGINSVNQDVTITVTDVDEIAPSVSITSAATSITSGVFTVTVEYSEVVAGFAVGDISVTNGTAGNFSSVTAGKKWTADITPAADGAITVNIAAATATDAAGNESTAATEFSIVNDETAPGVTLSAGALTGGAYTVTAQFSESVTGFDLGDVTISGGTGSDFTAVDGDTYTFSVSSANPSATVDIATGVAGDVAGNDNTAASQLSLVFNSSPTDIVLSNASIDENNETGAIIGNFSTTDTDATDAHTYSLVSGDGDTDNASFTVEGISLKAAEAFDFETKSSYSIRVKTDDGRGGSFEKAFTISIDNVAEPEVTVSGTVDFPETQLGITVSTMITISNIGEAPVEVIASSAPADFSVTPGSVILMAGESRQVNVNFTPTQEATYSGSLIFTYNGLQATLPVSGIGAIVTGIDDPFIDADEIRLYPNPASEIVNVDLSQVQAPALNITMVNASGKTVNGWTDYRQKQLSVQVGDLDNGLYIIQFTDGKSVVRKKVIIRK